MQTQKDSVEPKTQSPSSEPQGGKNNEIVMISNDNDLKMNSELKQKAAVPSTDQSAFNCHAEYIGKTVFCRFLKDGKYLSRQNRNSSNILWLTSVM